MSNLVSKNVKGTRYRVLFPTLPERSALPSEVTLLQREGYHDILTMEFRTQIPSWLATLKTGVPVEFEWTQGKRKTKWYGYVTLVRSELAPQKYQPMKVQCVGSSYVLKQSAQRIFKNKTIKDVAEIIASENGLSFTGDNIPNLVKYKQLGLTGESYWEWLQTHAAEIGCAVFVSGTRLFLKRIQEVLDVGSTDVPVLQMWDTSIPVMTVGYDRTLISFNLLNGEYVERGGASRTAKSLSGVDTLTGKEFTAKTSPKEFTKGLRKNISDVLFEDQLTGQVSESLEMARSKSAGAALLAQFSLPARAVAQGDPRLRPFYPVFVEGTGVNSDGYWMISEVVHEFHIGGDYRARLLLLTDGAGPSLTTLYRTGTPNLTGTLNLKKAIMDKRPQLGDLISGAASIRSSTKIVKQGNQGFLRTPTRWKSTR